jgi:hypothetical protein
MDPVAMVFYAIVCGGLTAAAPSIGSRAMRLAAGAAVGLIAAGALPLLRRAIGI